jgi:hypothetical protein
LDLVQTDINLNTTVFAGKISGVSEMSKYSDDEFVEFIPASDVIHDNIRAKQVINTNNEVTPTIDMTQENHQLIDPSEEETNSFNLNMITVGDNSRFQIRYAILRDKLPTIIVFHCSGKLVESNCLVLHNTFKMCSIKNLPFIIFDMTDVSAVEKEVWVYFSSKVAKLQKLNGILLFAGIRSEVLSETTDFNKLNICHCDTVATCCLAIRNLTHEHEKTDNCMLFDEDDSSVETQSNIHDFLYSECPSSELPEMKLVDSLLNRKNDTLNEKQKTEHGSSAVSSHSQPEPEFSPFEKTVLINGDSNNPISDAKRKVIAELGGDKENVKADPKPLENVNTSQTVPEYSPFEKTVLINGDSNNPISDAKRKVMAELRGDKENVKADPKPLENVNTSQTVPEYSPFEKTVLINDDGSDPIANAKSKVMNELAKESGHGKDAESEIRVNTKDSLHQSDQSLPQSQLKPDFSPFEKTILINDDGSNPMTDIKRKVIAELKVDMRIDRNRITTENKETVSELLPIENVNPNSPGLFEKTILLDEKNGSPILDAKKKILEELARSPKITNSRKDNVRDIAKESREKPLSNHAEISPFEKTVLFDASGVSPIAETKKKVMQELGNDRRQEYGTNSPKNKADENRVKENKEKTDSPVHSSSKSHELKSKPVVSDKSQTLSLKDLFIDDSMSTDYSIIDKSKETPQGDTDEMLPLVDESQGIDFSQNDKTVMSQSATVDISKSSLGLTSTNISLKNITPSDPYSVHYGVYEKNADEQKKTLPFGKTTNEKLTASELIFRVIADYGPVNILQLKNHINERLDKKDRINTLKLFGLLRQVNLDTHEKRVRYYRSC